MTSNLHDNLVSRFKYESFSALANDIGRCDEIVEVDKVLKTHIKYILSAYQFCLIIKDKGAFIQFEQNVSNSDLPELSRVFDEHVTKPLILSCNNNECKDNDGIIEVLIQNPKVQSVLRTSNKNDGKGFIIYVASKDTDAYSVSDLKFAKLISDIVFSKVQTILLSQQLKKQNEVLSSANETIHKKNETIYSSIRYASHIQKALLQSEDSIRETFSKSFVIYKPRDVVSGDFYLSFTSGDSKVIVVADCTGHGVPGAILSIFGVQILREIFSNSVNLTPHRILETLDKKFQDYLIHNHPENNSVLLNDGMDISIVLINEKRNTLSFSGAIHSMQYYSKRNNELKSIKGQRIPIGNNHLYSEKTFRTHNMLYEQGDRIYLYSDGYIDQFGGKNGKKFMLQRFKQLLIEGAQDSILEQKLRLKRSFTQWKGVEPQLDDVLVVGVEL